MRRSQYGAAVPSSAILGGAARRAVGQSVAVFLGHHQPAVLANVGLRVEGATRSPTAEAAVGCGEAGEVGVVGRGAWARGGGLKGRELGHATQLQGGGLVIEAVVGEGPERLFGRRRSAGAAGAARGGGSLGADDRRRTVDLAEVCERDLESDVSRDTDDARRTCAGTQRTGSSRDARWAAYGPWAGRLTVKSMFPTLSAPLRPHDARVSGGGSVVVAQLTAD